MKKHLFLYPLTCWFLPVVVFAADTLGLDKADVGLSKGSLESMIANIVKAGLTLVGAIALAMIVYGGFLYISAAGDEAQIKKAKTVLIYAIIGIIVIGLAYALVAFVIGAFGGGGGGSGSGL
jgi:hypothetical protein